MKIREDRRDWFSEICEDRDDVPEFQTERTCKRLEQTDATDESESEQTSLTFLELIESDLDVEGGDRD